jgi:hypothetical protein
MGQFGWQRSNVSRIKITLIQIVMETPILSHDIQEKIEKLVELKMLVEGSIDRYKKFIDSHISDFSENTNLLIFIYNDRDYNFDDDFSDYTKGLAQVNVISEEMAQLMFDYLKKHHVISYSFFKKLVNIAIEKDLFTESKINPFLEKLLEKDVISKDNLNKIQNLIQNKQLKEYFDLLEFCQLSKKINLKKYIKTPSVFLENLCREVASLLPEWLDFSNFCSYFEDNNYNNNVTISFDIKEKTYKHTFRIWSHTKLEDTSYNYQLSDFYKIFNKALAVQNSVFRLHIIQSPNLINLFNSESYFENPFYFIALTEEQENIFIEPLTTFILKDYDPTSYYNNLLYDSVRPETPIEHYDITRTLQPFCLTEICYTDYVVTSETIEMVNQFRKIGIFNHLPIVDFEDALLEITRDEPFNETDPPSWILRSFPNITCRIYYLDAVDELDKPYMGFLKILTDLSNGKFNPQNIIDNYDGDDYSSFDFSFELNGEKYHTKLEYQSDHTDLRFMDLVKKAVKKHIKDGQFYFYSRGEYIVFLNNKQYKLFKSKKLIDFSR